MDEVVAQLLSYKTVLLAVLIVILTFFIRRVVETAVPSVTKDADENAPGMTYLTPFAEWWNKVILYAIPVVVGLLLALGLDELRPDNLEKPASFAVYGVVVGWLSSFVYKVLRKVVKQKTGVDLPGATTPPPPGTDEDAVEAKDPS